MSDTEINGDQPQWYVDEETWESLEYVQVNKQYINQIIYYKSLLREICENDNNKPYLTSDEKQIRQASLDLLASVPDITVPVALTRLWINATDDILRYLRNNSDNIPVYQQPVQQENTPDEIDAWNEEVDHLMNVLNERMDELLPPQETFIEDPFRDALDHMNDPDDDAQAPEEGEIIEEMTQDQVQNHNEPQYKGFTIVSYNAQKSGDNLRNFLENNVDDVDIVLVQEPPFNVIKKVVSTINKDGDDYENTISHRQFIFLGAHKDSRVMTCVHKKWAHLSLQLNITAANHKDIQCIEMFMPNGNKLRILNVYNDSKTYAALRYLEDKAPDMPELHVVAGNFNLRHYSWDKQEPMTGSAYSTPATDLISLLSNEFNMELLNTPEDPHT